MIIEDVITSINDICKNNQNNCNACALTVAFMFQKYEKHVEMVLENIFGEVKKRAHQAIIEARK